MTNEQFISVDSSRITCVLLLGLLLMWTCTGVVPGTWTWTGGGGGGDKSRVFILSRRHNNSQNRVWRQRRFNRTDFKRRQFICHRAKLHVYQDKSRLLSVWADDSLDRQTPALIGWFAISRSVIGGGEFSICVARGNHRRDVKPTVKAQYMLLKGHLFIKYHLMQ